MILSPPHKVSMGIQDVAGRIMWRAVRIGPAAHEDLPYPGNIISFTQSAARKAISPVFALQG